MALAMGAWGAANLVYGKLTPAVRWYVTAIAEWRAPAWDDSMRRF